MGKLVITRRAGESVDLTLKHGVSLESLARDGIVFTLLEIEGTRVRIAFDAPDSVSILRSELKRQPAAAVPWRKSGLARKVMTLMVILAVGVGCSAAGIYYGYTKAERDVESMVHALLTYPT